MSGGGAVAVLSTAATVVLVVAVGGLMFGCPQYNVYSQRLEGEAELAKANYSRQVAVAEAQAKLDAAKHLAAADVERAKGVAQSNQIIGDSLKGNEKYLQWLWIDKFDGSKAQTIYIPTEGLIPFLEAGRTQQQK